MSLFSIKKLRPSRVEHYISLSLLIFAAGTMIWWHFNTTLGNVVRLVSVLWFLKVLVFYPKHNPFRGATSFWMTIVGIWTVVNSVITFFFYPETVSDGTLWSFVMSVCFSNFFMPHLIVVTVFLFRRNYDIDFRYIFNVLMILAVAYLIFYPFAFHNMTSYELETLQYSIDGEVQEGSYGDFISKSTLGISQIAVPAIMIYFKKYLTSRQWWIFMACFIGSILLQAYMARRGGTVTSLLRLVSIWFLYLYVSKVTSKVQIILVGALIVGLCVAMFSGLEDSFFSLLMERGTEDSRSGVENNFYSDMNRLKDWVFGRGWFGAYYDVSFGKLRQGVETGWLTIILRGGLLYFVPYVGALFFSALNGFFRSKNLFVKAFAIYNAIYIFTLYPWGWPAYDFAFWMSWVGVVVCTSPMYLRMTDNEVWVRYFK